MNFTAEALVGLRNACILTAREFTKLMEKPNWRHERQVRRVIRRDILRTVRKRWREGRKAKRQFVSAVAYASQTPFKVAEVQAAMEAVIDDPLREIRKDPELMEAFVELICYALNSEQKAGLARRKLRTNWHTCMCPPDERMMKHRLVKPSRPTNLEP